MFDTLATEEQLSATPIALLAPPRHPNYDTAEGRLFRKAMGLIEDERNWSGSGVGDCITTFCSVAAVVNANGGGDYESGKGLRNRIYDQLHKFTGNRSLPSFNDTQTHTEVMAAWRACGTVNGWL